MSTADYGKLERLSIWLFGVAGILFLAAPMLIIMAASLDPGEFFQFPPQSISARWYGELMDEASWLESIGFSLQIAMLTGLTATIIGGLGGIGLARMGRNTRRVMYAFMLAPLAVPPIVLAVSLYGIALRVDLIGNLGSFVFVNALLTTPLVVLYTTAVALDLDPRIELASLSCGAGRIRTLFAVTIPMLAPTAMAGGVLAFLLTLDEVVISSFLVGPGRTPLAVKLFLHLQTGATPIATSVATLLILASACFVVGYSWIRWLRGRSASTPRLSSMPLGEGRNL